VYRKRIVELSIANQLPTVYTHKRWVESGGLVSYGANFGDFYRRLATYVDKILKGAKPADLPVEQPTTLELVINLKAAGHRAYERPPRGSSEPARVSGMLGQTHHRRQSAGRPVVGSRQD
jgi:putative ABC transport system substrate-binding protein